MKNFNLKKMTKKQKIISIAVALLVIVIAIIFIVNIFFAKKDLDTKILKNQDVYINFQKEKFDFKGDIKLDRDNNVTNIELNGQKTKLYSEPLYFSKKKQLILPTNYSITFKSGEQKKVNYYTILKKVDNDYYLVNNNLNFNMTNNFLYDGSDIYIFVNDADVKFGNETIKISPMSYVNYVYNTKELYIYDYENDEIKYFDNINDNVIVSNDYYKVNVSTDIVVINNKDKLLMKNFNYLKKLK